MCALDCTGAMVVWLLNPNHYAKTDPHIRSRNNISPMSLCCIEPEIVENNQICLSPHSSILFPKSLMLLPRHFVRCFYPPSLCLSLSASGVAIPHRLPSPTRLTSRAFGNICFLLYINTHIQRTLAPHSTSNICNCFGVRSDHLQELIRAGLKLVAKPA